MDKIKIAIVEDDYKWLQGLTSFLSKQDDFIIVFTATNKNDAINLSKNIDIDVIIMDINLNENKYDGIEAAMEILEFKKVKIIMLTSLKADEFIKDSFTAGAVNYITKDNFLDIPRAIRDTYCKISPIEVLLKEYSKLKEEEQLKVLTPSERKVFEHLEDGYNKSQVKDELCKSESTIKRQVNSILKKLNAENYKEAIKIIKSRGLFKKFKNLK